jgi:hypothetical protein
MKFYTGATLLSFMLLCCWLAPAADNGKTWKAEIPKVWDDAALAEWPTPVAGLNIRPTHIPSKEYYSLMVDNLRTYPVYFPGREPEGYWEMLQHLGPKSLIDPKKLKTEADWIEAGRRVFVEADHIHLRTFDSKLIAIARDPAAYRGKRPLPDGTASDIRWVPTRDGVALGIRDCSSCHTRYQEDGTAISGAPRDSGIGSASAVGLIRPMQTAKRVVNASAPFHMGPQPFGEWLYQAWGVPWRENDVNVRLKTMTEEEYAPLLAAFFRGGGNPRWNGSIFFPTKIPDLIGIKDRKYIDHTATHQHRGIGDLMRYAALVDYAETADFGRYHMLAPGTKRVSARMPDEALYALALYIYSLKPPPNPNPLDTRAQAGQKIFAREGCPTCHTPPLYTSNKLTLAKGFTPPNGAPTSLDVLPFTVGTDPGLALETRKGTGYYKVPSLKGVWYRGHYLHDGAAASLEEMFDPERLKETHVPGGYSPPDVKTRAIPGHEFGLKLESREREQLIAFLRAL